MVPASHPGPQGLTTITRRRSWPYGSKEQIRRCLSPLADVNNMIRTLSSLRTPDRRSPFAIIWMFAGIVLCLLILANFSLEMLSSMRAYVGGESLWSKSQKDAVFHLQKFAANHDPEDLRQFHADIAIPLGDHDARVEMNKPKPDMRKIRQYFLRGGIHPDDIDGMFNLYRRFEWVSFMQRAIHSWEAGDFYIARLEEAGTLLQLEIASPAPSSKRIQSILVEVSGIN